MPFIRWWGQALLVCAVLGARVFVLLVVFTGAEAIGGEVFAFLVVVFGLGWLVHDGRR